jgi:hypothetical protein
MESLGREINRRLERFKIDYTQYLGESFALETANFPKNDPAGNLATLVEAVNAALRGIHNRGEKDHPLWDVRGVCSF